MSRFSKKLFMPLFSAMVFSTVLSPLRAQVTLDKVESLHRAVRLNWRFSGNPDPSSFRIYRSLNRNGSFQLVQEVPGVDRAKFDYWLTNGATYYYRIATVDLNGNNIGLSNVESGTPVDSLPKLYSITPNRGANNGLAPDCRIFGINFAPGDNVKLSTDLVEITAQTFQVFQPDQILATFDLRAKPAGVYNLVIVRENTFGDELKNAFTITTMALRFTEASDSVGLKPNNFLSFGSAWGDYDNDGWPDLFIANHEANNQLFHNNRGKFELVGGADQVGYGGASGVAWSDYDNDGDLDLFIGSLGDTKCLLKNRLIPDGRVTFVAVGDSVNLRDPSPISPYITGATWADYDLDGDLDLYLTDNFDGAPNRLYRQRNGIFDRLNPDSIGVEPKNEDSYSPLWADYDNDGDSDLYICNGRKNRLYRNRGDGTFEDVTDVAGVGGNPVHTENAAWGDYDNDGDLDLYLVNTNDATNILYQNNGNGIFTDVTPAPLNDAGYGFAASWGDYDNDGDLDLFLARGGYREKELQGKRGQVNRLFENLGKEQLQFVDVTNDLGLADSLVATAAIWGDYDNDGFLDLFVAVRDERSRNDSFYQSANKLYRNSGSNGNNWTKIRLEGVISNRAGIGARVELHAGNKLQVREINGGDGRSHDGVMAHFGLGPASNYDFIKVRWPSGIEQFRRDNLLNETAIIKEPNLPRVDTLIAEALNDRIVLRWTDNRSGTEMTAFNIYRDTQTNFNPATVKLIATSHRSNVYADTTASNNFSYTYWIRGVNASENLGQRSTSATAKLRELCNSGLLGDFVLPCNTIDMADLTDFAAAYRRAGSGVLSNALKPYDIGPASGQPPNLLPLPDGKIDFEDLVVFIQMWRSFVQAKSFQIFANAQNLATNPENALAEITILNSSNEQEDIELVLQLKTPLPLKAGQFQISYHTEEMELKKLQPGKAFFADGKPPIFIEHGQKETGIAVVMINCENGPAREKPNSIAGANANLLRITLSKKSASMPKIAIIYEIQNAADGAKVLERIETKTAVLPGEIILLPNYPNPFFSGTQSPAQSGGNPSTHIQFGLPKTERVRLSIFDVVGREVAVLVDEIKSAGFHNVAWNGLTTEQRRASSGVYFYKLQIGQTAKIKKMLFLQ